MEHKYQYTSLYYGTPCQVRFCDTTDSDNIIWRGGIAYHDFIICGCCGTILPIQEIIDSADACGIFWDDAIIELEWLDISKEIIG